jgi:hypothetical protein
VRHPDEVKARSRSALNWLNGSTLLGLAVARLGGARPVRGPDGLWLAEGHRLPGPRAAFTVGDVVLHPSHGGLAPRPRLLEHERRHAEQYARLAGLPFLPLYGLAALVSWLLTGDRASANPFERSAGLAEGGYAARPLRWRRPR